MKKYQIIYADPPWSYNGATSDGFSFGRGAAFLIEMPVMIRP